ncbi:hypothetical protein AMTRI_Chr11g94470 [Amborella trichopoda]
MVPFCSLEALERKKPYVAMLFVQCIYAGMTLFSKVALDVGMNQYVFVAYRQATATIFLAPFAYFLERKKVPQLSFAVLLKIFFVSFFGITSSLNIYCIGLKYTSATLASATTNSVPVMTFLLALLFRVESVHIRSLRGLAKVIGVMVCMGGALIIALYKGPPLNQHHLTLGETHTVASHIDVASGRDWIKGTFLLLAANATWSLWLVLQGPLVMSCGSNLLLTTLQCLFSSLQSALVALALERSPNSWKLGWDLKLISVAYCGIVVTGISFWLQVWCIEKKGPVFMAMFTPLALLITAIFSTIVWSQLIYLGSVLGGALLIIGLYFVLWGKSKEEKVPVDFNETV